MTRKDVLLLCFQLHTPRTGHFQAKVTQDPKREKCAPLLMAALDFYYGTV